MTEFNLIKCPQFLDNAITPPAKEIGITLSNIFHVIFSPINYNVEKLRIKQSENLKKYELDIQSELSKIPEEKLIEPPLNIVGPALEASKFYIEEEEIRKMFAKLIATSMNLDTSFKTHPSFIEIIKQLNSDEAKIIKLFSKKPRFPIVEVRNIDPQTNLYGVTYTNFSLLGYEANCNFPDKANVYLENLARLGLGSINYDTEIKRYNAYDELINSPQMSDIIAKVYEIGHNPNYAKGVFIITSLGREFYNTCVS